MAKQEIKQRHTDVRDGTSVGTQVEQTFTVDDSFLPSPEELARYKEIDPLIVEHLIRASIKEQDHRHSVEDSKIDLIGNVDKWNWKTDWWGMCFAFLCILLFCGLCAYALYLDKPWFAGLFGVGTFAAVASLFINRK
jgi:uncharacterized membrane protein